MKIRPGGIFETNSSATHAFIIGKKYMTKEPLLGLFPIIVEPKIQGYQGYPLKENYEDNFEFFRTPQEKLGYFIAQLSYLCFDFFQKKNTKADPGLKNSDENENGLEENGSIMLDKIDPSSPVIKNQDYYLLLVGLQNRLKSKFRFKIHHWVSFNHQLPWDKFLESPYKIPMEFWADLMYHIVMNNEIQMAIFPDGCLDRPDQEDPRSIAITKVLFCESDMRSRGFIIRDNKTEWVLFDQNNGLKLTFEKFYPEQGLRNPDVIDIKITDMCYYNCPMCSEDSTMSGEHADLFEILTYLNLLKPLEVAIGGGNPLLYPKIIELCQECRNLGMTPNITIHKNDVHTLFSNRKFQPIIDLVGGIGISVESIEDIKEVGNYLEKNYGDRNIFGFIYRGPKKNLNYHLILGRFDPNELIKFLKEIIPTYPTIQYNFLILGQKHIGRGQTYQWNTIPSQEFVNDLYSILNTSNSYYLIFDTLAVEQLKLEQINSSPFYMGKDGESSFFIDFVNHKYAISSNTAERHVFNGIGEMLQILNQNQRFTLEQIDDFLHFDVSKIISKLKKDEVLSPNEKYDFRLAVYRKRILGECQGITNNAIRDYVEWIEKFKKTIDRFRVPIRL